MSTSTRASIGDLPNELLFAIFPQLPLKSLIAVKGVCRHWRSLVPETHLSPARRRLLSVFDHIVASAPRDARRPRVAPRYLTHDREEYLQFLTGGTADSAPDDFVVWVREWPAWGVFGWLWPDLDERKRRPSAGVLKGALLDCALAGGGSSWGGWGVGAYGWTEPASVTKPHVKCVTFTGGRSPLEPGAVLRVTKVVPIEFAGIGIQSAAFTTEGAGDGDVPDAGIDLILLCFGGGNRALVLDGKNGGEDLKGMVYKIVEGYALTARTVCATSWADYLRAHLMTPHPTMPPVKFHMHEPTAALFELAEPF